MNVESFNAVTVGSTNFSNVRVKPLLIDCTDIPATVAALIVLAQFITVIMPLLRVKPVTKLYVTLPSESVIDI